MAALVLPCEFLFCSGEGGIWELLAAAGDGHATHRKRDLGRKAAASTTVVSEPAAQTASQSSYKGWYSFKISTPSSCSAVQLFNCPSDIYIWTSHSVDATTIRARQWGSQSIHVFTHTLHLYMAQPSNELELTYSNSLPEVVSPRTQEEVPLYPTEILKGLYTWLQPLPATV
ncbi:hypothetical protein HJG60_008229 [Phyllostomus discolor]|uniref:Uncharacterized protein n=1 Tax=Phyllostomus discolor TaxID=89673 RepID=A0A833Z8S9_9CHIR|nr:hypothetical protein HJG60_008229 [Phyllostomus discolor]